MDEITRNALRCAEVGLKLTPVAGKTPILPQWPERPITTEEQILEQRGHDGWGLILGEGSGVIDVECDSAAAFDAFLELVGGEVPQTVSWQSARGMHFLFRWSEGWPNTAVIKHNGVEFRIGNKAAQSVLPPSNGRSWVIAPWDGEVQEFHWRDQILVKPALSMGYLGEGEPLDVERWLKRHSVNILGAKVSDQTKKWFIECPRQDMHTTPNLYSDCMVTQAPDGSLGGKCFHQSCGMGNWQALKTVIGAPDWLDYHDEARSRHWGEVADRLWPSKLCEYADEDEDDDSDFCLAMIPETGLLREIYEYYDSVAFRSSPIMGLAVALSLCQTIFGRKIATHTNLRTNDYNVVMATTGSGKEACESAITKILEQVDPKLDVMMPADVQSGNGLMNAIALQPCRLWVCDEFGKILQAVLDKRGNQHLKNIGTHLLKLYGKSSGRYTGAAHSEKIRNAVDQPHLCVLGLTTGSTVFSAITHDDLTDGLLGRMAWWPVAERPEADYDLVVEDPSQELIDRVKSWWQFAPNGFNLADIFPKAIVMKMEADVLHRWKEHGKAVEDRMQSESEIRAAIWARVNARAMKLALVHRAARLSEPSECVGATIEAQDVNWGIKLANWLARVSCQIVQGQIVDEGLGRAKAVLSQAIATGKPISTRSLLRANRGLTAGDLNAAAAALGIEAKIVPTGGRPKRMYLPPIR